MGLMTHLWLGTLLPPGSGGHCTEVGAREAGVAGTGESLLPCQEEQVTRNCFQGPKCPFGEVRHECVLVSSS